jgi:hypothetical protein
MSGRIVHIPDLAVTVAAALFGIIFSLTGFHWQHWIAVPVAVRFAAGVIAFGLSPGLLIAGPLMTTRSRTMGPVDFIISVFTCSFSCNLVFNIVLFTSGWPFADLAYGYLLVQALGYALWAAWALRSSRPNGRMVRDGRTAVEVWGWTTIAALAATGAVVALAYVAFVNGSPPANPEELVALRKLAENPVVRYDNISFRNGDPSTYLFVPFQILMVGTSVLAHLDVVLTYSLFWAVTTILSIAVIARLAHVMFGHAAVAVVVCLLSVAIGFFDARSVVESAGIVTPYPNRYGFGSGVLMPLSLLLFWSILRDPGTQLWRWGLLIYLVVETTFVHARETILTMGAMAVVFVLLSVHWRRHRIALARIAGMLGIMLAVLLIYRHVNLSMAGELNAYVSGLSDASERAAGRMFDEYGFWPALVTEAPPQVTVRVDAVTTVVHISSYRDLFVEPWKGYVDERPEFLGRLYLPIVFLLLPWYALRARSVSQMTLPLVLAGLGIVTAAGPLQLFIAAIVGNPEIFVAYNLVFLFALLVFCDATYRAAAFVAGSTSWLRTMGIVSVPLALLLSFVVAESTVEWRLVLADAWSNGVAWALLAATVVAAGYRVLRYDLPLFSETEGHSALPLLMATGVVLAVMVPAMRASVVWREDPFDPEFPPATFTGNLLGDYDRLEASEKLFPAVYPVAVVRFLREALQPNQIVLSRDTLALLVATPHFSAIVTVDGRVPSSYIANADYLRKFARREGTFEIYPYLADEDGRRIFKEMVREFDVDVVVVDPTESDHVRRAIEEHDDLRLMLQQIFASDGFLIYAVDINPDVRAMMRPRQR